MGAWGTVGRSMSAMGWGRGEGEAQARARAQAQAEAEAVRAWGSWRRVRRGVGWGALGAIGRRVDGKLGPGRFGQAGRGAAAQQRRKGGDARASGGLGQRSKQRAPALVSAAHPGGSRLGLLWGLRLGTSSGALRGAVARRGRDAESRHLWSPSRFVSPCGARRRSLGAALLAPGFASAARGLASGRPRVLGLFAVGIRPGAVFARRFVPARASVFARSAQNAVDRMRHQAHAGAREQRLE